MGCDVIDNLCQKREAQKERHILPISNNSEKVFFIAKYVRQANEQPNGEW